VSPLRKHLKPIPKAFGTFGDIPTFFN